MPFVDANASLADFDASGFDQVVVGAGAAGILIAVRLAERGKRVLLVESGHFQPDEDRQRLNAIEEVGKPLGDAAWTRKRIIGGTTTAWGGQSVPFPAEEFQARDWIEGSGWPIGKADLEGAYDAANRFMGIDTWNHDSDLHRRLRNRPPDFDPAKIGYHYSKWARQPNFLIAHRQALERGVVVLFNAQLLRIDLDDNHRAAAIEIGDFTGQRRTLPINGPLILAMGGIESVRTLLLNDHQHKAGLGGAGGWLGRAFMEHPCLEAGWIDTDDPFRLQSAFGTRLYRGSRYGSRVEATSRWQADHRMLGATAGVMWLYEDGDVGPLSRLRGLARRPGPAGVARAFKDLGRLAPSFWALATQGLAYKPGARASLVVSAEQAPDRESRIGLSDRLDPFGRRQALLDWRIGPQTWTTIVAFVETLRSELSRLGLGQVRLHEHLRADEPDWETHLSDVNHHMGGARMSRTAGEGVVDADLAVWGTRNLHVCSAAVFPTGGHSNPTLTALALGERLAARLAGS